MQEQTIGIDGQIVFWNLSVSNREAIKTGLLDLGLSHYDVPIRSEVSALSHAVGDYCKSHFGNSKDFRVENRRQPSKYGVDAVQINRGQESASDFEVLFGVKIENERIVKTNGYHGVDTWEIQGKYTRYRAEMPGTAVAKLVIEILREEYNGTALRPSGGIYWVPARYTAQYRDLARLVENSSLDKDTNKMFRVNTRRDAETLRAVKEAIIAETEKETMDLMTEVNEGSLGKEALQRRQEVASLLRKKIEFYETDLGTSLDSLKSLADTVDQALALSVLAI